MCVTRSTQGVVSSGGSLKKVITMRRSLVLSALCAFVVVPLLAGCNGGGSKSPVPTTPGSAPGVMDQSRGKPTRVPIPPANTLFPAGSACTFALQLTIISGKEKGTLFPVQPNGDQVEEITGSLTASLTNLSNNKSITANLSGPGKVTLHADGSATFDARGNSFFAFAPTDTPAGPDAFISSGPVDDFITASGQQTLQSESGARLDVCNALS